MRAMRLGGKVIHLTATQAAENPRYWAWLHKNHRGGLGPTSHWPIAVTTFTVYAPWQRIARLMKR